MTSAEPVWAEAWEQALASMEMDVNEAEAMLAVDHVFEEKVRDPWIPPTNLGPLPAHLTERARVLLARQLEVSRQLAMAARNSRRQDKALSAMSMGTPSRPVYLDTPA